MKNPLKKVFYLVLTTVFISCGTNKPTDSTVNTKLNAEYRKSEKALVGKLNDFEFNELKGLLEKELNTKIPTGKSIFINYEQKATNCFSLSQSKKTVSIITDNGIRISSKISLENNAIIFFVYSKDSYHKDIYQKNEKFKLDSGFFHNNVFTIHENCSAFFIIKPNGSFLKYYGGDNYSDAELFLKSE